MRHPRNTHFALISAGVAAIVIAATGCADAGPRSGTITIAVAARPEASTTPLTSSFRPSITVSENGNTLVITRAQLVLRGIELVSATAADCVPEVADDDCAEINVGPVLLDIPVDGATSGPVAVSLSAGVPAGSYTDLELELHKISSPDNAREQAFLEANPTFADVSARVEGTYNGQPFVFTARANSAQRFRFGTPLVVDGSVQNVTVNVD
ncbi:MAG TPA: hypothetical protein VG106_02785, partial [Vicinamibacterales bacterium]|nr:hypothetical protein [Vicinamibacterales bacterium]